LQQATEKRDALEIFYEQAKSETQKERENIKGLEKKVEETYKKIPQAMQRDEITAAEKIDRIAQKIDQYHKEIENLLE
jgi:phosphate uptake regulator